jgi:photosystem II stability/assembly factor-like uncharacterized protein
MAASPIPGTIVIGTDGQGVYRTTDGGETWSPLACESTLAITNSILVDPVDPQTLWAGTNYDLCESTDDGLTWIPRDGGHGAVVALAVDAAGSTTLLQGLEGGGIRRSVDGGSHWSPADPGILGSASVRAIAFDRHMGSTVYAGGSSSGTGRAYRSTDGGATWTAADVSGSPITALVADSSRAGVLFAGGPAGAYRSTDAGATWTNILDAATSSGVLSLAIPSRDSSLIHAGTTLGVLRSSDGGVTWISVSGGLSPGPVTSLLIKEDRFPTLYAGTADGVSRAALPQPTAPVAKAPPAPVSSR